MTTSSIPLKDGLAGVIRKEEKDTHQGALIIHVLNVGVTATCHLGTFDVDLLEI